MNTYMNGELLCNLALMHVQRVRILARKTFSGDAIHVAKSVLMN
jgi:hypothetical protein